MCSAHLADDDAGLCCVRADIHEPHHGCIFQSTSGLAGADKEE